MEYLVAGLGNPGDQYQFTRHNAGFLIADRLANRHAGAGWSAQFQSLTCKIRLAGHAVILVKPQTYMNRSGQAVRAVMDFYKIPSDRLIAISDDIHLETGVIRVRPGGGAGGHNGLTDIIRHVGTQTFSRVRFGVGSSFLKGQQADYVLSPFARQELDLVLMQFDKAADAVETIIGQSVTTAMNVYN